MPVTGRTPWPEWWAPRSSRSGILLDQADSPAQTRAEQSTAIPAVVLRRPRPRARSAAAVEDPAGGSAGEERRRRVMTVAVTTRATRNAAVTGGTG
ncbi:hypothetical protein [Planomonospora venezuelensis]|uniref:hypothetical protein n=1 Tax=Planomonospora venezuelensis TaxID=1999 RepID=UPI0031F070BE